MGNRFMIAFIFMTVICFCSADIKADALSVNSKVIASENELSKEQYSDMKTLYESLQAEMNDRFEILEENITKKVDALVQKAIESIKEAACEKDSMDSDNQETNIKSMRKFVSSEKFALRQLNDKFENDTRENMKTLEEKMSKRVGVLVQEAIVSIKEAIDVKMSEVDRKRSDDASGKLETNLINMRKFVSSEKIALRNLNEKFENDTHENMKNLTDVFEERIKNIEQIVAIFANSSETRMAKVENKMLTFENKRHSVHFSVSLKVSKSIYAGGTVKFENVFTNEGGGYSPSTGVFTAPYSGTYLLLFFVEPDKSQYNNAYFTLYVNGKYRAYAIQETLYANHDSMAGQAYVEYMSEGQKAWIQAGRFTDGDGYHEVHSHGTTFTGVLIN